MDDVAPAYVAVHPSTTAVPQSVDTLAYPISPEYVKSWTPVQALCELIANALDEDPTARIWWADGVLTISDNGPGIPEEGLVLGYSTKTGAQIGQFGEGKKLACLVLARSPEVGQVRCDTVGYGFTPAVERRRLLDGIVPSRSTDGTEVLVYHLYRSDRTRGTVITVACPKDLADQATSRFRALSEPDYRPLSRGVCVLTGAPGRVWIGGVLVTTMPGLLASYDLPLDAKGLQNRDRTVIEAGALRDAVRTILADSEDQQVINRFARHVLDGGKLREQEQYFADIRGPRVRAAWRTWARTHLRALCFYTTSGNEEAKLDLIDKGYTELTASGLSQDQLWAFMDRLGVEIARSRRVRHYERTRDQTTWVPAGQLTNAERTRLARAQQLIGQAIGAFALDRVRVYSASEESPCSDGFYAPRTGDVAIHRDALVDGHRTLRVLLHEAGHRVAHRGGGRWMPVPDYQDRTRGFERVLCDFAAVLLACLGDGGALPEAPDTASAAPRAARLAPNADPAVPAVRRELAHLLLDQVPHALTAGGFTDAKDLVASTAVHPDYWRTLTHPKVAGHRQQRGGRAWDYDKVALLAEAAGLHPPVVWLGYHLCEGPIYGRARRHWDRPGPWTRTMRDATLRACTDLQNIGGAYAEQIPALQALADGRTRAVIGDDSWHTPARTLVALERQRLGLAPAQPQASSCGIRAQTIGLHAGPARATQPAPERRNVSSSTATDTGTANGSATSARGNTMLIRLNWVDATDEVQVLDPGEAFAIAKDVDDPEPEGTYSIITANGHDGIQIAGTAHALHDWLNRARARLISKTDGPRIMSVLDLSTHHLPQHVRDQLSAYDGVTAHHTTYGWLLAVPGDLAGHRTDHSGTVPDAVWALWEYAHRFDAEYVLLDADADRVDALASWDR